MYGKIKFVGEKQRYTVYAFNDRFAIMTKPFNAQKTYLYTITDLKRDVRGRCNLIFGLPCDVNSVEGAAEALAFIESGGMEVTFKTAGHVKLNPCEIEQLKALKK